MNSPHKGQWRGALVFPLICAWINGSVNNHEAGALKRHRAHYDVNLMTLCNVVVQQGWYNRDLAIHIFMVTSSNGNIFRVTGLLCVEFTGRRWIPLKKASHAELWCFLRFAPWINCWVNNSEAGDLRRRRGHYDVIVRSGTAAFWEGTKPAILGCPLQPLRQAYHVLYISLYDLLLFRILGVGPSKRGNIGETLPIHFLVIQEYLKLLQPWNRKYETLAKVYC